MLRQCFKLPETVCRNPLRDWLVSQAARQILHSAAAPSPKILA
jgi:hypothetical protein